MFETLLVAGAIAAGSASTPLRRAAGPEVSAPQQAGAAQAPRVATAADAAPFLGEWALALQGPDRAGKFDLSIRRDMDKVMADITAETMPKQAIKDVSISENTLLLGYSFTWEGNPVDAVVSLTPEPGGKMKAQIDFANGAYIMSGPATKKDKGD